MRQRWPERLWIVRHGESAGNVAAAAAYAAGHTEIAIGMRDVDVPLSANGEAQAAALGRWFGGLAEAEQPEVVLPSPYLRARRTAALVCEHGGLTTETTVIDERLREREFGVLDRLTRAGIEQMFPDQAKMLTALGKFYYRPPGGESWCDVVLRLRSALDTVSLHYADRRVLIVAHQVVVLCLRYVLEAMTEEQILGIDAAAELANCSITAYDFEPDQSDSTAVLKLYNLVAPLEVEGAAVTTARDAKVAAR